ncbi:MAG: acyl-CoA thioesterase [bacterium]
MSEETVEVKVYYADTDAGGVVYYGTYLRFLEVGRTEFLQSGGLSVTELLEEGYVFVVTEVNIKYKSPAGLGDILEISTRLREIGHARVTFEHEIRKKADNRLTARATVRLGCCSTRKLKPVKLPSSFHSAFNL